MPNLGLLGITMQDEKFFEAATEGSDTSIDFDKRAVNVGGKEFRFQLSQMEKALHDHGGVSSAFRYFGNKIFEVMTNSKRSREGVDRALPDARHDLQW